MRSRVAAAALLAALAATGCGGIVDPSKNVTETFPGTIPVQGTSSCCSFSTSKQGEFTIKVTSLAPTGGAFFGTVLAYAASDGSCVGSLQPIQQNSFGTANTPALTGLIYPGRYCIFLFDIGSFTVPQTYTLTVSHP
jgi:hypothetical protein